MNIWHIALRERALWRQYPKDRLRWLIREHRNALRARTFRLGDVEYPYFLHPYNHTWANERAVELPVALSFLSSATPSMTLEIGNVLSHYIDFEHTVLDKCERCWYRPILNEDLLEFTPKQRFDFIVSISTIEHIGWDSSRYGDARPRDEAAVMRALQKLQSLLTPGGKCLVTVPVGYNHYLDRHMPELISDGIRSQSLKRISDDNQWVEVDLRQALTSKYGEPYKNANAVVFLHLSGTTNDQGEQSL